MICVFSFCDSDCDMALEVARHIECLAGVQDFRCMALHPENVDARGIAGYLESAFSSVDDVSYAPLLCGWPDGPNLAFFHAAQAMFKKYPKEPWLWLEADCVPMRSAWLKDIAAEYRFCDKSVLGAVAPSFDALSNRNGEHVTGVAVYPGNFLETCPPLQSLVTTTEQYRRSKSLPPAFDVYLAPYTLPNLARTKTIRHYWKAFDFTEGIGGLIRCKFKAPYGASNIVDMDAAVIHGCKDFSLLTIVQKRLCAA